MPRTRTSPPAPAASRRPERPSQASRRREGPGDGKAPRRYPFGLKGWQLGLGLAVVAVVFYLVWKRSQASTATAADTTGQDTSADGSPFWEGSGAVSGGPDSGNGTGYPGPPPPTGVTVSPSAPPPPTTNTSPPPVAGSIAPSALPDGSGITVPGEQTLGAYTRIPSLSRTGKVTSSDTLHNYKPLTGPVGSYQHAQPPKGKPVAE